MSHAPLLFDVSRQAGWLTVDEVAAHARVPKASVRRAVLSRQLPAVRTHPQVCGGLLIGRGDVDRWTAGDAAGSASVSA